MALLSILVHNYVICLHTTTSKFIVYYVFVVLFLFFFLQMLYTSSALSLYYPYDFCLSPDMDALTATGLKFIPPFVAIVISLSVIIGVYANR